MFDFIKKCLDAFIDFMQSASAFYVIMAVFALLVVCCFSGIIIYYAVVGYRE